MVSTETPPTSPPEPEPSEGPRVLITPVERAAIVQEIRRAMLNALVVEVEEASGVPKAAELTVFRELCKDYESPSSLQLEALENRIQALENATTFREGNVGDGTIMMGP